MRKRSLKLTYKELEVLRLAANGLQQLEIAERLDITRQAVKMRLLHSFTKLGAQNCVNAVAIAIRNKLI